MEVRRVVERDLELDPSEEGRRDREEDEPVRAGLDGVRELLDAPVRIRLARCDELLAAVELDAHPLGRLPLLGVENVRRDHALNLCA